MIHPLQRLSLAARRDASLVVALLALAGCHSAPPAPTPETRAASNRPTPSSRPSDATPSIPATRAAMPAPDSAASKKGGSDVTPVYSPEEEHARFTLADGYRMEL